MQDLISIVIPVYNIESYLKRCINSIVNQTYNKLEIILIDDGSTDNSGKICDEYAQQDDRIKVIHKDNSGVSSARNKGIDTAQGQYIAFVDGDDFVSSNYIEYMYNLIKNNQADIVNIKAEYIYKDSKQKENKSNNILSFSTKTALENMLKRKNLTHEVWGKLYKTELFSNIRFPVDVVIAEDLYISYKVTLKAKKIIYSDVELYKYCVRDGSVMRSDFNKKKYAEIKVTDDILNEIENIYPELKMYCDERRLFVYCMVLYRILHSKNKNQYENERKAIIQKIKANSKNLKGMSIFTKVKIYSLRIGEKFFEIVYNIAKYIKEI